MPAPCPGESVTPDFQTWAYTVTGPVGTWSDPCSGQTPPAQPMAAWASAAKPSAANRQIAESE